jgi:Protein of unknown function (DUF3800)
MTGAFVIDDTGSPGVESNSRFLKSDRKTWCGLILSADEREHAEQEMAECLSFVQSEIGISISEFHFTDIWNKRGTWENVKPELQLGIFDAFAEIYHKENFRLLVTTFHATSLKDNGFLISKVAKIDGFDLNIHSDAALMFLLFRFKQLIKSEKLPTPVDIIIDEGRRKAGHLEEHSILDGVATYSSLNYQSSATNILIQIVDFAAFCLNRAQILYCKPTRTKLDNKFLSLVEHANFNFLNLQSEYLNLDEMDVDTYDYHLWLKYAQDGSLNRKRITEKFSNFWKI